jgi:hypothetical protein
MKDCLVLLSLLQVMLVVVQVWVICFLFYLMVVLNV